MGATHLHAGPGQPHRTKRVRGGMNTRLKFGSLACLLLAACNAPAPSPAGDALPAAGGAVPADGGRLQWQARLPCADCDAIQTRLQLQRDGGASGYVLTEVYVSADGDARFAERGQWQRDDDHLWLRSRDGAQRQYAVLPDGRLQPLDRHGQPLPARQDGVLLPVADAVGR